MTVNYLNEYTAVRKPDCIISRSESKVNCLNLACTANFSVSFFNITNGKPAVGQADQFINVSVYIHSTDCNFEIQGMFTDNDKVKCLWFWSLKFLVYRKRCSMRCSMQYSLPLCAAFIFARASSL